MRAHLLQYLVTIYATVIRVHVYNPWSPMTSSPPFLVHDSAIYSFTLEIKIAVIHVTNTDFSSLQTRFAAYAKDTEQLQKRSAFNYIPLAIDVHSLTMAHAEYS
jgi:hypothetical protein